MPENIPEQPESADETTAPSSVSVPGQLPLNKSQKLAVAVLAFFTMFVLVFWAVSVRQSIMAPFELTENDKAILGQINSATSTASGREAQDEVLKKLDSDQDGLSDYDELNMYQTSAYIADSDSDGFTDFDEIRSGNDPNCPAGRTCQAVSPLANGDNTNANAEDAGNISTPAGGLDFSSGLGASTTERQLLESTLSGASDAASLRQLLVQAGMDAALLKQISDEDLMKSYQEVLGQSQ